MRPIERARKLVSSAFKKKSAVDRCYDLHDATMGYEADRSELLGLIRDMRVWLPLLRDKLLSDRREKMETVAALEDVTKRADAVLSGELPDHQGGGK